MSGPSAAAAVGARWRPRPRHVRAAARHGALVLVGLVILVPLLWIVFSSIKSLPETYRTPPTFLPREPTLEHYAFVLTSLQALPSYYANSVVVTGSSVLASVLICSLAGYAFGRLDFPGRDPIFWGLIVSLFLPTSITSLFAVYELTDRVGLLDTRLGLILPYTAGALITGTFIMRSVFMAVPGELEDAARIDGAGAWGIFLRIMLPLGANGVVVVTILNFINIWGEYLIARTLTLEKARTLPVGIALVQPTTTGAWHFGTVMAAYMLMFFPAFVILVLVQRWFMKGLTEGAIKW
ncbi:MAG TPA: carbohydrate ABC transporter permease [Chloroflexota bacterium]|nr:carbohydrate ABC transporter permease [Chloroflexota bacterium]